jgi:Family of unknown function (DUF6866) C-terminal domain/Family of unknown function (DUF6866) N-terminal domain
MSNLGQVVATVQRNCHISDAQYAGDYTLCVFLLKMREFYRWENQIPFNGNLPRDEVGRWMQEREQMWEHLETSSFEPLALDAGHFDPFDSASVNRTLVPKGYVYSAGYGRFNKPHFFLGALTRQEQRDDVTVYISSCEYARDLVAPPAMMQGNTIYLRQESLRRYLWERIEEWRWNRNGEAMAHVVGSYDFGDDVDRALDRMTEVETESTILHELGEALAEKKLGEAWPRMLLELSRTKAEIMARAVRDLLADCLSTLPGLIERNDIPALHFYFANFSGMRRHLFPEALVAYQHWHGDGNVQTLKRLAADGQARWFDTAMQLVELHQRHGEAAAALIEGLLEDPPTCQILTAQ